MSTKTSTAFRIAATALGAAVIISASAAMAGAAEIGEDETVDLGVTISDTGALTMTVAGTSASLTENTIHGDPSARLFEGTLPTVTVTDTRSATANPPAGGVGWSVVGTASDFVGSNGQPNILAGNLGWAPALVSADDSDGLVTAGDEVDPGEAGTVFDQELLIAAADSLEVLPTGSWQVNAGLALKTSSTVAPGSYSSTLTLSLFEN